MFELDCRERRRHAAPQTRFFRHTILFVGCVGVACQTIDAPENTHENAIANPIGGAPSTDLPDQSAGGENGGSAGAKQYAK